MIAPKLPQVAKIPLKIVGSNKFGRYPKISNEKVFNMFMSDGWMVSTPGHLKILDVDSLAEGRGIFTSVRGNIMVSVIGSGVWITKDEIYKVGRTIPIGDVTEQMAIKVGDIESFSGDVFIDENDAEQIGICDKQNIYIYNYSNNTFQKSVTDFIPGYITFQDGYFIASDLERNQFRLSAINNGLSWPAGSQNVGELETKPDNCKACVRVPGHGNQLFVMGSTVTESWNDLGYKLFPYNRTNSFNIDYGCVNQATIATSDEFVIWLGSNEKSSPIILISDGGKFKQISTDGINRALANLEFPEDSYGMLYKFDGHLFYHLTFTKDNVTHLYDISSDKFYFLTDEQTSNHIAKKVTFFANDYYFISLVDGNIYRMGGDITTYDGEIIPRIRMSNNMRLDTGKPFVARSLGFTIEQGESSDNSVVDISLSYDGGVAFGNSIRKKLNVKGKRRNRLTQYGLGKANELTCQFRFWGTGRFVCTNGYLEIYS